MIVRTLADLSDYEVMLAVRVMAEKAKIPTAQRDGNGPPYDLVRLVLDERDRLRGRESGLLPVMV